MGIFLYDDLVADAGAFLRSVCRFLGVAEDFPCTLGSREMSGRYDEMEPATRQMLIEAYRGEVTEFFRLIGRELPWLE
jgi:hypothetical protein